jgi:hypothetical protein
MEIWKEIDNLKGKYLISNYGNVKSLHTNIILKPGYNNGYAMVRLNLKMYYVHRLVAIYFIKNYDNKNQVNHIDLNKANNHIDNLEWCSSKENMNHYYSSINYKNKQLKRNNYIIIDNNLKGITFYKPYSKWRLRLNINGLQKSLGYFNSKEEALEFKNTYI